MTLSEELQRDADLAKDEGGMYYSGQYLQGYADRARLMEAENAKLREFVRAVAEDVYGSSLFDCGGCRFSDGCYNGGEKEHKGRDCQWYAWSRELGIEVDV